MQTMKSPDEKIRCLFVQPAFAKNSYWNYVDSCELIGAKTPAPPLGLLTVAAIFPQHWEFRLLDLNAEEFNPTAWQWADMICVGGMLPQQTGILEIIKKANREGKFVAVGGADPSSQPAIYKNADALIVGEGETAIPDWINAWRNGQPRGTFQAKERPDVTKTPIPRFDLLNFNHYNHIGVQYSRGCPFNCEFCDIIELYGRKPRTKTPEQVVAELETLYQLGYRGHIDLVDDNFIGNKRNVKLMLPELIAWSKKRKYPYFYSTEASMNLADDIKLLELMQDADFRFVFMGIETPDPETLLMTQKSQNTMKPIVQRIHKLYEYGMVVTAGFILGFDNEKSNSDQAMIRCIEDSGICMAMVGLLVALPNTQLTRRLAKEGRLISFNGEVVKDGQVRHAAVQAGATAEVVDQTVAGLNYVTTRDRVEILREFLNVVQTVYSPERYFKRVLRTVRMLKGNGHHLKWGWELRREAKGAARLIGLMARKPHVRGLFFRNLVEAFFYGPKRFEFAMRLMGIYIHFEKQTAHIIASIEKQIAECVANEMKFPRILDAAKRGEKTAIPAVPVVPVESMTDLGLHAG